jgi:hypothetical protein
VVTAPSLTIQGNGATIERSGDFGVAAFRLLEVAEGANLTSNNLTLQGGLISPGGNSVFAAPIAEVGVGS